MRSGVPTDGDRAESPTPIVGRTSEIEELDRALANPFTRLLTVTGPPGVGKTRLAREVAIRSASRFQHGVHFVDLSPARTVSEAFDEIGRCCGVVGLRGRGDRSLAPSIGTWLRDQTALIILDCCERLPDLGRELSAVLGAAPRVKMLTTSRTRLGLAVESELALPPLAMPEPDLVADLDRLAATPAVTLLLERARQSRPGFTLDAQNAAAVRSICVRADGLPLAIELLAARLASFSPAELAVRVQNRQVLLDSTAGKQPGRHRTLRAAIAWSHDLLGPCERKLLRTASVFPHTWTLAAAEHVLGDPDVDVLAVTDALVDRSLVQRSPQGRGSARFRMLDSIREFATEQLELHSEGPAVRRRHMAYYAGLAVAAEAGFGSRDETLAMAWMEPEHANLRTALHNALATPDVDAALPLAAATGWFEYTHGLLGEGRDAVDRALAAAEAAPGPALDALAGVTLVAGVLAESGRDLEGAESRLRETIALSEQAGDLRREAVAHAFLGHVARHRHRYEQACLHYTRALALHEATANRHGSAWAWFDLGILALETEDLQAASDLLQSARAWFATAEEAWPLAWTLWALGETRLREGDTDEAAALLVEAVRLYRNTDDLRGVAQSMEALAAVAAGRSAFQVAAKLLGASEQVRDRLHAPEPTLDTSAVAAARAGLVQRLGSDGAERAFRAGRAMPLDEALRLATSLADPSMGHLPTPLTERQQEVAVLVAAGRTNRQIARTLGITEKTVEVHLAQAMKRIGAHSRAEVAAHAVGSGIGRPVEHQRPADSRG